MEWSKLLSGRYFLTLCAGCTFSIMAVRGQLPPEMVGLILVTVMKDYFTKGKQ